MWRKNQSHPELVLEHFRGCGKPTEPQGRHSPRPPCSSRYPHKTLFLCSSFHATQRSLPPGCCPGAAADSTFIFGCLLQLPGVSPRPRHARMV